MANYTHKENGTTRERTTYINNERTKWNHS